jgi:hypothetical protein
MPPGTPVAIAAWTSLIIVIYLDGLKQIAKPTLVDVYPSDNFRDLALRNSTLLVSGEQPGGDGKCVPCTAAITLKIAVLILSSAFCSS